MIQGNGWIRSHRFWRMFDGLAVPDLVTGTPLWKPPYPSPWAQHGPTLKCFRLTNVLFVQRLEDFGRVPPKQVAKLPAVPYSRS